MNKNLIVFFSLMTFFNSCHYGTGVGEKIYTPKEFFNNSTPDKEIYSRDSIYILKQLRSSLGKHELSFYNKEYFDSTQLFIDTILYNTSFKKIAVLVIAETPMYRRKQEDRNKEYNYWYDAFCYLGLKNSGVQDTFRLKWQTSFYPINWYKKSEISNLIRDMYFTEFATIKDTGGAYQYKYNLNDKRFWDCSVWDEYFSNNKHQ